MVQEVQQDMNMFNELDETEWIWYVERRLSYKTQIRDKEWIGASYCKLGLYFSATIPAWASTSFDNMTIEIPSNDVRLDEDHPNRIYITPWVYILSVKIYIHNGNINYRYNAAIWENWEWTDILKTQTATNIITASAVVQAWPWAYLTNWLYTDTSLINTNESYLIITKLW